MMGCGKSTVGKLLAGRLGLELADTDRLIEAGENRTIPEIFAREGEEYFRARERETAEALAGRTGLVVACGGGLPLQSAAIAPLKSSGTVFFLRRDPGLIYDSVSMEGRPLGQGGREEFLARFARREPVYRRWADFVIEGVSTAEEAADAVIKELA